MPPSLVGEKRLSVQIYFVMDQVPWGYWEKHPMRMLIWSGIADMLKEYAIFARTGHETIPVHNSNIRCHQLNLLYLHLRRIQYLYKDKK